MKKHADFIHLHNHSQFSLLDGACRIDEMVRLAAEYKMPALALTDHGNLFGVVEFYRKCRSAGVVPIIGCEMYVAADSRLKKERIPGMPDSGFHLVVLAQNMTGYKNLVKLSTAAYLEGFYHRPRIDLELLEQHREGLIATSACAKGEVAYFVGLGATDRAEQAARRYLELLGPENFFIEIQNHGLELENRVRPQLIELARKLGIGIVATNDCHYLQREHADAHDALLCIQTGKKIEDTDRMRYQTDQLYFKPPEEMKELFADTPDAIENTLKIAESCRLEFNWDQYLLPEFPLPAGYDSPDMYLADLAERGLRTRYSEITPELQDRLRYELSVISRMGFPGYFLICKDFIDHAKSRGIPVGPGRGSAAGSLVSYALGITNVDPIKFGLLFERFLNPERISMPDIDIDFSDRGRDEIIRYVIEKYGHDSVCQIITFGTMAARGVVRDVGRVMGLSYAEVDRIAKMIPFETDMNLEKALTVKPELKELADGDPRIQRLLSTSQILEGLARHASTHAAGVVIAPGRLDDYVPLFKSNKDEITTQFDMQGIERIGLLKMDFLGLRTLTVIDDAARLVGETRGITLDPDRLPLDDPSTYELFTSGETVGVFQFESSGMRDYLRKLRPECLSDLVAMNALYRPGPLDANMIDEYIDRKHGRKKVRYDHPKMESILNETYGVIVFQDQVMKVAAELAGFSMAKADHLRKAMGKKNVEIMARMCDEFIAGCRGNGINEKSAREIFEFMATFARYGFNKSHSTCYAILAYQTAYLKVHYPVEFMAALLSSETDNTDRVTVLRRECQRMDIPVLPPDINTSLTYFSVEGEAIRFGLGAVKNVGHGVVERIVTARQEGGPFRSVFDFMSRVDTRTVNRRALESLIAAGAFDTLGVHRAQLTAGLDLIIGWGQAAQDDRARGQHSLFGGETGALPEPELPEVPPWSEQQSMSREKDVLGFYVSGNPLDKYADEITLFATCSTDQLDELPDGSEVALAGVIQSIKTTIDKKGNLMAFLSLEDYGGTTEVICFAEPYARFREFLGIDSAVLLSGTTSAREEERPKLILQSADRLADIRNEADLDLHIHLNEESATDDALDEIEHILDNYVDGRGFVYFHYHKDGRTIRARSTDRRVASDRRLVNQLRELLGNEAVYCTKA
jgi:DNA polymerase-3 subunit alpha